MLMKMSGICLGLSMACAPSFAATMIAAANGTCELVVMAGKTDSCSTKGVVYMQLPNGHVMITIGLSDKTAISFVGDKDSQTPEQYLLYLSRMRRSTGEVVNVAGTCNIKMTADGMIWHRIDCTAEDANSAVYRLRFLGDEQPIFVQVPK